MATLKHMRMRVSLDDPAFPGLKKVKVHGKELSDLPRSLFSLVDLEMLDLSPERESCLFYKLVNVPPEIRNFTQLKILILDTNHILQLPNEICQLKNLERLTLSNNYLKSLPTNFSHLRNLRSLHCANNRFAEIPTEIFQLMRLVYLDFTDNQITKIHQDIGKLNELECLMLSYNQILKLPPSLCSLKNLQTLWLSGNQLKTLPREFGNLVKLDWNEWCSSSALDGNPLEHPPLEIAKQGPQAIAQFFELFDSSKRKSLASK